MKAESWIGQELVNAIVLRLDSIRAGQDNRLELRYHGESVSLGVMSGREEKHYFLHSNDLDLILDESGNIIESAGRGADISSNYLSIICGPDEWPAILS